MTQVHVHAYYEFFQFSFFFLGGGVGGGVVTGRGSSVSSVSASQAAAPRSILESADSKRASCQ